MRFSLFHRNREPAEPQTDESLQPLTRRQLFQHRQHQGVNIGGLFVLEKWIDDSLFTAQAKGDAELDALESQLEAGRRMDQIRHMWEKRWYSFLSDEDWDILAQNSNAIRLPIGYWLIDGGKYTEHTPFEKFKAVYYNAWAAVRAVVAKADNMDLGVLIDVHALPGGVNTDAHSGTSTGKSTFWASTQCQQSALEMYAFIVSDLASFDNVIGIELMNELQHGEGKFETFSLRAAKRIRRIDPTLPIIIPDGWDVAEALKLVRSLEILLGKKKLIHHSANIIVDTHVYRTFSEHDRNQSALAHIQAARSCVPETATPEDLMVGEFSACLDEQSWALTGSCDRMALEDRYCRDQTRCFDTRATAGRFFWTFKFANGAGGTWDFREMVKRGGWRFNSSGQLGALKVSRSEQEFYQAWVKHRDEAAKLIDSSKGATYADGYSRGIGDRSSLLQLKNSQPGRPVALCTIRVNQYLAAHPDGDQAKFSDGYLAGLAVEN